MLTGDVDPDVLAEAEADSIEDVVGARRSLVPAPALIIGLVVVLIVAAIAGIALAGTGWSWKQGCISGGENWITVPEMIQPRMEVRLASITAESGRSADATVVDGEWRGVDSGAAGRADGDAVERADRDGVSYEPGSDVTVEDFATVLRRRRDWAGYASLAEISQACAMGYRVLYVFWADSRDAFAVVLSAPVHTMR